MSFLSRIFGKKSDDRAHVRALWHRTVEIARETSWYADCGVADTVPGRFDTITLVLSLVLLRMEREDALIEPSVRLTEIFVDDMDGQLRESGVGDIVVGKKIGKLMSVLGGRLGAYREALAQTEADARQAALTEAIARNVTLTETGDAAKVAARASALAAQLDAITGVDLLAAKFER